MTERHGTMRPERLKDPYLGWRYVLVGCDFCGAKGRYKFIDNAKRAAKRHNEAELLDSTTKLGSAMVRATKNARGAWDR
jgi:hypothetical protein